MKNATAAKVESIRNILRNSIDTTPERVSRSFKTGIGDYAEHDQFLGICVPTLRKIAKGLIATSLDVLDVLIQSPINEERLLALIVLTHQYSVARDQEKEIIYQLYRKNIPFVNNWNLVDSSAHLIIGAHLFQNDRSILEAFAQSKDLWERRIAIVATWYFIRKGDLASTFKISKMLINDKHDLIHKAVGWMLREAGKKNEIELVAFLSQHHDQMPKTMLRYAMERLTLDQKAAIKG